MNIFTKSMKISALMMLISFFTLNATAQKVIWSDDFATDLAPWTTLDKASKPKNNIWVRSTKGPTGQYKIPVINSATAANGFALFDSDTYCSNSQDAWLISPKIDMSNENSVVLFFSQQYRKYNDSTFVMYSIDNGVKWNGIKVNGGLDDTDALAVNPTVEEVDLSSYVANQANVRIAFRFMSDDPSNPDAGCGYSWMIDDVKLVQKPKNNLRLFDFVYGPANYATPVSQIEGQQMTFAVDVKNGGTADQPNVKLSVQVNKVVETTLAIEKVIYKDSLTYKTLPSTLGLLADTTFSFSKLYTAGKLAEGLYEVRYSIASKDSIDFNPADNTRGQFFRVTKSTFAKENGPSNAFRFAGDEAVGNMFTTGKNWGSSSFIAKHAYFAAAADPSKPLINQNVNIYLFKVEDKILADFSNFDVNADLTANEGLKLVGVSNYTFPDTSADYKIMKVNLEDFDTNVLGAKLEAGKRYFLMASYEGEANKIYPAYSKRINYYETSTLPVSTVLFTSQWFLGGAGAESASVMRLEIALKTSTDDQPLAETAMNIAPNPANEFINVDVNLEKAMDINICIATVTGQIVDMQDIDAVAKQKIQLPTDKLANGTYLIRLTTKEGTKTRKFVVQH
jgi:Secretion system C-terminal sorting domain/CARDB